MTLKTLLYKAFVGGQWIVGIKDDASSSYKVVPHEKGTWLADPLLYQYDNKKFLFVEVYNKRNKKADIGYYDIDDNGLHYGGVVISNHFHMSYPCVFKYGDSFFMIPETSANSSLELYRSHESTFPKVWSKEKTIIKNIKLVDTTVLVDGDKVLLFSYTSTKEGWCLIQFELDMSTFALKEIGREFFEKNIGRPAGYFYNDGHSLYRPAQDCSTKYGERLLIYKVDSIFPFEEKIVDSISYRDVEIHKKVNRTHTLSKIDGFTAMDFFVEKIDLFHWFKILKRSHSLRRK